MPVDTEVAHDCPKPRRKLCGTSNFELSQSSKSVFDQLLADELKTIRSFVGVWFEMANDLIDERRVFLEEVAPRLLGIVRR